MKTQKLIKIKNAKIKKQQITNKNIKIKKK